MPPRQPRRALLASITLAAPMTLLVIMAYAFDTTAAYAWIILLVLSIVTAFAASWYVHAVEAILFSVFMTGLAVVVTRFFVGIEKVQGLTMMLPWLFAAGVVGAIVGIFVRPFLRGRQDREK